MRTAMTAGPRLPLLREVDLDERQHDVWNQITGGRRASVHGGASGLVSSDGTLIGPFNALLHSPSIGGAAAALGEAVRFDSTFDRRTTELIIVVVAVHWRADFEYWAHRRAAIESGVPAELIEAVAAGGPITAPDRTDEVVVAATRELLTTGRMGDDTYSCALELLRPAGIVDLVTLVGYYTLVSFNLNAFEVQAPVPSAELWPSDPAR